MYKVYIWTHKETDKKYVGVTSSTMEKRAGKNGYHYNGSPRFYAAIQKYGLDSFSYRIVKDNLSKEEAAELEVSLIEQLKTTDPLYGFNLQEGGFPTSVGERPKEIRDKISETLKKQRSSSEYRKIMSSRMKAVWDDPIQRATIIARRSGKPSGKHPVKVYCEETGLVYDNLHKAGEALGTTCGSLSAMLKRYNGHIVIGGRGGRPKYTLHIVNVHNKESELLEASADNAGGNQQPSTDTDSSPVL